MGITEDRVKKIVRDELNGSGEMACWVLMIIFVIASFIAGQILSYQKMRGLEHRIGALEQRQKSQP